MSGWIKLHRSIKENWIYDNPEYLKAWITILMDVNHKGNKVLLGAELVDCPRGSSLNSLSTWASKFGHTWTIRKVRTFLKLLENDKMIDRQGLSKTTRLSVCNYGTYQDTCQANDTQSDRQMTNRRQTDVNKQEGKELKEREELKEELPVFVSEKLWNEFKEMRRDEKKPLSSQRKIDGQLKLLKIYEGNRKGAANRSLEIATIRCWIGLVEPKESDYPKKSYSDLEHIESIDVYVDREKLLVFDANGATSIKYAFFDGRVGLV